MERYREKRSKRTTSATEFDQPAAPRPVPLDASGTQAVLENEQGHVRYSGVEGEGEKKGRGKERVGAPVARARAREIEVSRSPLRAITDGLTSMGRS